LLKGKIALPEYLIKNVKRVFTGIIEAIGHIVTLRPQGVDLRMRVVGGKLDLGAVRVGDSIAVSGVCLTVTALPGDGFEADVSGETLARSTFSSLVPDARVNLECALTPNTRLGGHLVSGHVDGVGRVVQCRRDGQSLRVDIMAPAQLAKYIAEKGSICVDGVSLTVNAVRGAEFGVNIIPHTSQETTLGELQPGQAVNLEVDIIARYLERLLLGERAADVNTN